MNSYSLWLKTALHQRKAIQSEGKNGVFHLVDFPSGRAFLEVK